MTDEKDAESPQGTKGKVQRFEGGPKDRWPVGDDKWEYDDTKGVCIYYSAKYGAHQVWGGIMICYERLEGIKSPLGFPISAERDATESPQRTTGWYQPFEGGSIHWCEKYSGVAVTGRIFEVFMRFGGSGGKFGFPMSSQVSVKGHEDMCQQEFEGGVICVVHK